MKVHDVPSHAVLKIAFIEKLLTSSNGADKSVRHSIILEMRDWCKFFSLNKIVNPQ